MAESDAAPIKPLPIDAPVPAPEAAEPASRAPAWVPDLLLHVFYPDSRKVGFGYQIFIWSTFGTFFARIPGAVPGSLVPLIDANTWLLCVSIAGLMIGGGTITDAFIEARFSKK